MKTDHSKKQAAIWLTDIFKDLLWQVLKLLKNAFLLLVFCTISLFSYSQFTDSGIDLGSSSYSICRWGDYDNDGDLDILLNSNGTVIYRHNENGTFTDILVPDTYGQGAIWIDYDNDDDLDFFQGTRLYKNLGSDTFQKTIIEDLNNFDKDGFSSTDVADYDNDGDDDIVFGYEGRIYILNNKDDEFILVDQNLTGGNKIGGIYINIEWLDADNDNHFDLLSSKLHKNNSENVFEQDLNYVPNDIANKLTIADYDSDGDMDAFYSGSSAPLVLMKNTSGQFTESTPLSLQGITGVRLSRAGDLDNDGNLDLILMFANYAKLCLSDGNGDFTVTDFNHGLGNCWDAALGDYNGDGDLDLLMTGSGFTKLLENDYNNSNTAPTAPSNPAESITGNSVTLSWDRSTDLESPAAGLTYNLCLINTDTNDTIKVSSADMISGSLFEPKPGNTQSNNFWTCRNLRSGSYEWTVQAIDNTFKGSLFADFKTFQIDNSSTISPSSKQTLKPDEAGSTISVTETSIPSARVWAYGKYPGGPYNFNLSGETGLSFTPDFLEDNRYFVIYKSVIDADTILSNEVWVDVLPFTETKITEIQFYRAGTIKAGDYNRDEYLDLLFTGQRGTYIYKNTGIGYSPVYLTYPLFNGDAAWCDLNRDNRLDLIVMGSLDDGAGDTETKIFINQGGDIFTEVSNDIQGLVYGSIDVGDYDHDGDQDVLVCGKTTEPVTKIYRNDGNGLFTDAKTQIIQVTDGVAKWGDYDNDSDLDIFISGIDFSGNPFSGLYRNDGDNNFSKLSYSFKIYKYSFAEFGDYDNDSDLDILLSGYFNNVVPVIYKNTGNDQFTEIQLVEDYRYNYVKWLDYDNDGLLDVLLAGNDWYSLSFAEYGRTHKILRNFGNDIFREISYKKAKVDYDQNICLADLDNDSDVDIFQSSYDYNTDDRYISFYENESYRNKTLPDPPDGLTTSRRGKEVILSWNKPSNASAMGITYDLIVGTHPDSIDIMAPLSDTTGGYRMVAQPGFINDTAYSLTITDQGKYYWRVQAINNSFKASAFSAVDSFAIGEYFLPIANPFIQIRYDTDFDWGDFDNDSDQDLLLCGQYVDGDWKSFTHVYENDGNYSFNAIPAFKIDDSRISMAKWVDVNNDNEIDICVLDFYTGFSIYENDGAGNFSSVYNLPGGTKFGYGDYNRDGLIDFLMSGRILKNKGDFSFENISVPVQFQTVLNSLRDFNNDMDMDVFAIYQFVFSLYRNVNLGFIKRSFNLPSFRADYTDYDAGDLDNDGDIDLIISGYTTNDLKFSILLKNEGNMVFSLVNTFIRGTQYGAVSLGDYDNDNDLDILLSGNSYSVITKIYENKGDFYFEETDYSLSGAWQGTNGWSDFDEDGDLDAIIIGTAEGYAGQTKLYVNELNIPVSPLYSPGDLTSVNEGYGIIFSWQDTLNTGTSYNVRVGTQPDTCDIVSPMADLITGKRKVSRIGNADMNLRFRLDSLAVGDYYWSVQAVNSAFKGSSWAPEQTFTISVVNAGFSADTVCAGDSTHFRDLTLTSGEDITSWSWDFGDGSGDTVQNPVHLYQDAGSYEVKLVANSEIYADSIIKTVIVKPVPQTSFTASLVCQGTSTTLTNTTTASGLTITGWLWNFGDGQTSTLQDPGSHGYLNPGVYSVVLWAFGDNGCSASARDTAIVADYPVASITTSGPQVFCRGDSVILSVQKKNNYSYDWLLDGTSITGADTNRYAAKTTGNYSVTVVNSIGGCSTTSGKASVIALNAPASPMISADGDTKFCEGDSVILKAAYVPGNQYLWKRNGGAVQIDTNNKYIARAEGVYSLTMSNPSGCSANSLGTVLVNVNPNPVIPTVSLSGPTNFCQGGNVTINVTSSPENTYNWRNESGIISGATSNSYTASTSGIYRLEISNVHGCTSLTSPVEITVKSSPDEPVITSTNYTPGECPGKDPIKLSITNTVSGYNYMWIRNGELQYNDTLSYIEFYEQGTYKIKAGLGECSVESDAFTITLPDAPEKPDVYVRGPVVWYMAASTKEATYYQWYLNNELIQGANKYIYVANKTLGTYKVAVGNENECYTMSDEVTIPVAKSQMTNFYIPNEYLVGEDEGLEGSVQLYPNPTTGMFTIEIENNLFGELMIRIVTEQGKEILTKKTEKTSEYFSTEVDLSGQVKGIYFINILIDKYITVSKVIIE